MSRTTTRGGPWAVMAHDPRGEAETAMPGRRARQGGRRRSYGGAFGPVDGAGASPSEDVPAFPSHPPGGAGVSLAAGSGLAVLNFARSSAAAASASGVILAATSSRFL